MEVQALDAKKKQYYQFQKCLICHNNNSHDSAGFGGKFDNDENPGYNDGIVCGKTPFCKSMSLRRCKNCHYRFCKIKSVNVKRNDNPQTESRNLLSDYCNLCNNKVVIDSINSVPNSGKNRFPNILGNEYMCKVCSVRPLSIKTQICTNADNKSQRHCEQWNNEQNERKKYNRTCGQLYCEMFAKHVCPNCEKNPRKIMHYSIAKDLFNKETYQRVHFVIDKDILVESDLQQINLLAVLKVRKS